MSVILLLAGYILIVGSARKALTTISHRCIHNQFSGKKWIDRAVSETLTTVLFLQAFDPYKRDHCESHHNSKVFATSTDPDATFLLELGFKPGMSKQALWKNLLVTLISPKFHGSFLWGRFKGNFIEVPQYRLLMSVMWVITLSGIGSVNNVLGIIVIVYIIPIAFLYHVSALIQFLSEHNWLVNKSLDESAWKAHHRLSWGRFLGKQIPSENLPFFSTAVAWANWFLWMLIIYPIIRISILPGDLSQHDLHHRKIKYDWPNAAYERQKDIEHGRSVIPYQDIWGVFNAIDKVFDGLSEAKPWISQEEIQNKIVSRQLINH